jgi:hypothetical protein
MYKPKLADNSGLAGSICQLTVRSSFGEDGRPAPHL